MFGQFPSSCSWQVERAYYLMSCWISAVYRAVNGSALGVRWGEEAEVEVAVLGLSSNEMQRDGVWWLKSPSIVLTLSGSRMCSRGSKVLQSALPKIYICSVLAACEPLMKRGTSTVDSL